jgi:hypothetical protein
MRRQVLVSSSLDENKQCRLYVSASGDLASVGGLIDAKNDISLGGPYANH